MTKNHNLCIKKTVIPPDKLLYLYNLYQKKDPLPYSYIEIPISKSFRKHPHIQYTSDNLITAFMNLLIRQNGIVHGELHFTQTNISNANHTKKLIIFVEVFLQVENRNQIIELKNFILYPPTQLTFILLHLLYQGVDQNLIQLSQVADTGYLSLIFHHVAEISSYMTPPLQFPRFPLILPNSKGLLKNTQKNR